ncbi:zf-HC2 domain-containing protein [Paenibacillus sp. NPDC058071]|uniref:zf-HC2 domain-containing protein n=1 Tax=Paenibacillus sp. NPDC058071 TaxID=3346326 RepID=UPI0036DBF8DB
MKQMNQGNEMLTISCGICRDLIPLVQDGVAGNDSTDAVMAHIAGCPDCSLEFGGISDARSVLEGSGLDDGKIMRSIRKHMFLIALAFLGCGTLFGISLTNTFGMFYNLLIMPFLGGFGYMVLRQRWYLAVGGILLLTYIWQIGWLLKEGGLTKSWHLDFFSVPLWFSLGYCGLSILGVLIAALLHYAFRKET